MLNRPPEQGQRARLNGVGHDGPAPLGRFILGTENRLSACRATFAAATNLRGCQVARLSRTAAMM